MQARPVLSNMTALGVRRRLRHVEIMVTIRIDGVEHPGLVQLFGDRCVVRAGNLKASMFADLPRIESSTSQIALIAYRPSARERKLAIRGDGQELLALIEPCLSPHPETFRNGDLTVMATTCKVIASQLGIGVGMTSGRFGAHPRVRITNHLPYQDPGFPRCLARWFGWSKWNVKLSDGCLHLGPETSAILPEPCDDTDLTAIWMAAGGLQDPRKSAPARASAHEIVEAERRYQEDVLPAALRIRDDIARVSRMTRHD